MATTVKQSFSEFLSNLEISDRQVEKVSNCHNNVVKTIESVLTLNSGGKSRLIGSYDRKTLTRYLSEGDVDVMVVLHYGNNKDLVDGFGSPARTLDKFKKILSDEYPKTVMRRDRNCVTMQLSEFSLDVVPAVKYDSGNYRIPDSVDNKWIDTNPAKFADLITSINKNTNSMVVPVIKMLKRWNKNNGDVLSGYHIECLVYKHYKGYTQGYTYDSTLKVFFEKLPSYLREYCYDPITGVQIDTYLDNNASYTLRDSVISKAESAKTSSSSAYDSSENGYIQSSIEEWKSLFGEFFPNYG
jgi:hypothetical protein